MHLLCYLKLCASYQLERGNLPMCLLWPHHRGAMSREHTCCMRSQSHERSRPPLFKLKFGNGWLTSKCCGSHCKKLNSGFQFQFQFQFQGFQFHFQFHQFQFQFQFRNWNWNWPAIPIPELNWPQPCLFYNVPTINKMFLLLLLLLRHF